MYPLFIYILFLKNKYKTYLTPGNETKCWRDMRKESNDELEITVKPVLTGRHILEIRILGRVVFHKTFESKPGKYSLNGHIFFVSLYM